MKLLLVGFLFCASSFAHQGKIHKKSPIKEVPSSQTHNKVKTLESINQKYKEEIKGLFIKSCFDCHSDKTSFPWYYELPIVKSIINDDIQEARSHIDFSEDFPFLGHGNAFEDLNSIKKAILGGSMPPLNYYIMNPSSRLSEPEKRQVLKWIESSLNSLSKEKINNSDKLEN